MEGDIDPEQLIASLFFHFFFLSLLFSFLFYPLLPFYCIWFTWLYLHFFPFVQSSQHPSYLLFIPSLFFFYLHACGGCVSTWSNIIVTMFTTVLFLIPLWELYLTWPRLTFVPSVKWWPSGLWIHVSKQHLSPLNGLLFTERCPHLFPSLP